jgi:cobalt-zinc-cadmium efflux system protein
MGLNSAFLVLEFVYGWLANSAALLADAGHNLSDVLGLLLSWVAIGLAKRAPNERFTYGWRSSSILAALSNAVILLLACGAIGWEAVHRFAAPEPVASTTVMVVATLGILVNGFSAWLFSRGQQQDLNVRAAYLHMLADAAISLGVVLTAAVIGQTGWQWLDPLVSLVIVALIVKSTWGLLKESMQLILNSVPAHIDVAAVTSFLRQQAGVSEVHDLHIWGLSTTEVALTAHLVMPQGHASDAQLDAITDALRKQFQIHHATLQIELGTTQHACALV